jgi:hypothetical protein
LLFPECGQSSTLEAYSVATSGYLRLSSGKTRWLAAGHHVRYIDICLSPGWRNGRR